MRLRGFRAEFQANGITVRVFQTDEPQSGNLYRVRLARWFKALPHPAAVLLAGDYRATEAFEACAQAGLAVPNDVAILGVDNDPVLCDSLSPSLSSVAPPFEKEGFEAARTLDRFMRARKSLRRPLILRFEPIRVVERDSTVSLVPGTHLIDRALEFIAANATQPISARDVAERLKVSPSLLALRFRQREKTTVRDAIIDARLKKVCALLKDRKMTVARIAARCGFASANRLTRLFTKRFGVSPRGYRNAAAQDL